MFLWWCFCLPGQKRSRPTMVCSCYLVWPQREGQLYVLLDPATNDTLLLDERSSFRALEMQHFYDSFALTFQICTRSDPLVLFDLREDELLPDLHITKAGLLRAGLGAHQEHLGDHNGLGS